MNDVDPGEPRRSRRSVRIRIKWNVVVPIAVFVLALLGVVWLGFASSDEAEPPPLLGEIGTPVRGTFVPPTPTPVGVRPTPPPRPTVGPQVPGTAAERDARRREDYLQIVAATNHKQRIRKTVEYYHADRLNYAVIGTPNRLEYDQGFFVKNGDGSADVKPIAHLYKSQVYALARYLELPEEICSAKPTTDTYSLSQGQDEFYFALPYEQMDLALWAFNHELAPEELGSALGISRDRAELVYADIRAKRRATSTGTCTR